VLALTAMIIAGLVAATPDERSDLAARSSGTAPPANAQPAQTSPTTMAQEEADDTDVSDDGPDGVGGPVTIRSPSGPNCASDGELRFGTLLPMTGDLAFLGPPMLAGVRLAVADINAAGGVLGQRVVLVEEDSGDTNFDRATPAVDLLLGQGVDVIIGAASSAVSKVVIDKITSACVVQFSPSNTSPDFATYPDRGMYFRTAPSDLLQAQVLAQLVASEGSRNAAVIYRNEAYGQGLAQEFEHSFRTSGGRIAASLPYPPNTYAFGPYVGRLAASGADAFIVIGFNESALLIEEMHEQFIGPWDVPVYGTDGNIGGIGTEVFDPTILVGMRGTEPAVDLESISAFTARLDRASPNGVSGVFAYGAEAYDAVIISALAAIAAGTDEPGWVSRAIPGVTKNGTECFSFGECKDLLNAGRAINYVGLGGSYELDDAGEPTVASFRIATYDGDVYPNPMLDLYLFSG
jgi:ABC-type branched-subunit amino acid transport system substrate-binding protein